MWALKSFFPMTFSMLRWIAYDDLFFDLHFPLIHRSYTTIRSYTSSSCSPKYPTFSIDPTRRACIHCIQRIIFCTEEKVEHRVRYRCHMVSDGEGVVTENYGDTVEPTRLLTFGD